MIKAILFDADGVLISGRKFSEFLASRHNINVSKLTSFFTGPFRDCTLGKADLKEIIRPYLREWGWRGTVDEFLRSWFEIEHDLDKKLVEYIKALKKNGIKCFLATNQEKYRIAYMLKEMGFSRLFDKVFASVHMGFRKPDLEFFGKVMDDLPNFKKDEILFWDDTLENIEAAREFGIKAEIYKDFEDFESKMRNYLTA